MADPRDELTLADMANEPGLLPPREPLRIRVSPYDTPPPSDTGWGGFGSGGRPTGRLFEPDLSQSPTETSDTITGQPAQPQKPPFQPGILSLGNVARGIGALVQGARDSFNAPAQATIGDNTRQVATRDPTAGPRQMWQQNYPSAPYKSMFEDPAETALQVSGIPEFIESGKGYFNPETQPGEQQQRAQQQVQAGANVAANLAGINAPFSTMRPGATAGLFGGRLSPAADQKAFDLAERMLQRGASEGHIRNVTGLTLFPDKKFRFEVSDKDAYYKGIPKAYDPATVAEDIFLRTNPGTTEIDFGSSRYRLSTLAARQVAEQRIANLPPLKWSDLMHHPEAEKAFPYLKDMPVEIDHTMRGLGAYGPPNKRGQGTGVFKLRPTDDDPRGQTFKVLLHEPMHKIQDVERFALGGNPDFIPLNSPAYKLYQDKLAQLRAQNIPISPEAEQAAYSAAGREHYRRLAGEKEADVVMDRADLTAEQRAAINPLSQMRVKPKDQIVDFGEAGGAPQSMQMSGILRPEPLKGKPGGPHPGGIHVYHSSPHDFDKFDWSKLRTGEGANTYGAGFYFAENPAVSGQGGQYWNQFLHRFEGPERGATTRLMLEKYDREKALQSVERQIDEIKATQAGSDRFKELVAQRNMLASGAPVGPRTYEVNIAARPELMLDWDKPLAQMSPEVQARLRDAWLAHPDAHSRQSGEQIYQNAQITHHQPGRGHEDAVIASQKLAEAGIPGIRYLDQGSRVYGDAAGMIEKYGSREKALEVAQERVRQAMQPGAYPNIRAWDKVVADLSKPESYNYVVTDPSKLDILAKYGIVGTAGAGGIGSLVDPSRYRETY